MTTPDGGIVTTNDTLQEIIQSQNTVTILTIKEVRTGKLETTGEAVGIRASDTRGLVTAFTGGYEISRSTIRARDEDRRYIRHHPRGRTLRESRWKSGH